MANDTRERILVTAAEMFRRRGFAGTSLKELVAAADAPTGSIYHHFPRGKEQVGIEVVQMAGAMYATLIPLFLAPHEDLEEGVREFFQLAGAHLEQSGWQDACPIATIALEVASVNEPMREATASVFEGWVQDGSAFFRSRGIAEADARALALALICALEGAFVLARSLRSTEPLQRAGEAIAAQAGAALARAQAAGVPAPA